MPIRGIDPMMTEANMSVTVTARPRGSVANTCGLNRSAAPRLASGQGGCSAVVMSSSATYRFSAPGCRLWSVSGHTQPSGRRSPDASSLARLADLARGHAVGQVEPAPASRARRASVGSIGHDGLARGPRAAPCSSRRCRSAAERADDDLHGQRLIRHRARRRGSRSACRPGGRSTPAPARPRPRWAATPAAGAR